MSVWSVSNQAHGHRTELKPQFSQDPLHPPASSHRLCVSQWPVGGHNCGNSGIPNVLEVSWSPRSPRPFKPNWLNPHFPPRMNRGEAAIYEERFS